jgi:AraC-like DNA-binding protein
MKILYDPTDKEDFGRSAPVPAALSRQIIAGLSPTYKIYHFGDVLKQEYRCSYFYLYFMQFAIKTEEYIHFKWDKQVHLLQYAFKTKLASPFKDGPGIFIKEGMSRMQVMTTSPKPVLLDVGDYKHLFIELHDAYWKLLCKHLPYLANQLIAKSKMQKKIEVPIDYEVMEIIRKIRDNKVFNEDQQIYFLSLVGRLIERYTESALAQQDLQQLPDIPHKTELTSIRNDILYEPNFKYHQLTTLTKEHILSESVLRKDFHRLYGTSIRNFVQKTCMEKARLLLTTTNMGIAEIAWNIGYSHEHSFARAFKEWHGISPLKLRLQYPDSP